MVSAIGSGLTPRPNRRLVGDAPRQGRAVAGLPVVLRPRVVNYSKAEPAELTLAVFVDGKEFDRKALTLQPGETALPRVKPYVPAEPSCSAISPPAGKNDCFSGPSVPGSATWTARRPGRSTGHSRFVCLGRSQR